MAAAGQEDDTLIWALDRLLDSCNIPAGALAEHVLPAVVDGPLELPDLIRAKLCLRLLDAELAEGRVDSGVLLYLQQLGACDVSLLANPAVVRPPRDLILLVKTELGIQTWRDQGLSAAEAEDLLNQLFAGENTVDEYSRYDRLKAALRSPALANALVAEFPFQRLLGDLINFVARALVAMPSSILLTVQEDLRSGRYVIGAGTQQEQPAAPVPTAYGSPPARHAAAVESSPVRQQLPPPPMPAEQELPPIGGENDGHASPQRQQAVVPDSTGRRGGRSVLRNLDAGLADLAQRGGQDPLPEMLQQAADASEDAAGAAVAAPRAGRPVHWGNESPAVQHPMPEMQPARYRRHQPLQHRSPARQQGERAVSAPAGQGAQRERHEGGQRRRKRLAWEQPEIEELVRLVKQEGRGCWAAIVEKGAGVLHPSRTTVDVKDKWRNLVKAGRITEEELEEIEAREEELRDGLRQWGRAGRPPKFVSPRRAQMDSEDEADDGDEEDPVEDADEEEGDEGGDEEEEVPAQQKTQKSAKRARERRQGEDEQEGDSEGEQDAQAGHVRRSRRLRKPSS